MADKKLNPAFRLTVIILVLMVLQTITGLLFPGLYRDNAFVNTTWHGNDLVSLVVAVPALAAALFIARRGSARGQLVWLGFLDYALYNYAFYLFGAAFNAQFLVYVALLTLSIFALILGLANLDVDGIGHKLKAKTPVKWIAGYMLFVAFGLSAIYLAQSLGFIFTGKLPSIIDLSGHPTSIVFALDLTLLVPFMVLGAIWLWQRKSWGIILAGITLVKGPAYTLVLSVNSYWASKTVFPEAGNELPLWVTLTILGLTAAGLLYRNMVSSNSDETKVA